MAMSEELEKHVESKKSMSEFGNVSSYASSRACISDSMLGATAKMAGNEPKSYIPRPERVDGIPAFRVNSCQSERIMDLQKGSCGDQYHHFRELQHQFVQFCVKLPQWYVASVDDWTKVRYGTGKTEIQEL